MDAARQVRCPTASSSRLVAAVIIASLATNLIPPSRQALAESGAHRLSDADRLALAAGPALTLTSLALVGLFDPIGASAPAALWLLSVMAPQRAIAEPAPHEAEPRSSAVPAPPAENAQRTALKALQAELRPAVRTATGSLIFVFDRVRVTVVNQWVFSRLRSGAYLFHTAPKRAKFVVADYALWSPLPDPRIPILGVFVLQQNGRLRPLSWADTEFTSWGTIEKLMGVYHEPANDFVNEDWVWFTSGAVVGDDLVRSETLVVATTRSGCMKRSKRDGAPAVPATYYAYDPPCTGTTALEMEVPEFLQYFVPLRVLVRGKVQSPRR